MNIHLNVYAALLEQETMFILACPNTYLRLLFHTNKILHSSVLRKNNLTSKQGHLFSIRSVEQGGYEKTRRLFWVPNIQELKAIRYWNSTSVLHTRKFEYVICILAFIIVKDNNLHVYAIYLIFLVSHCFYHNS